MIQAVSPVSYAISRNHNHRHHNNGSNAVEGRGHESTSHSRDRIVTHLHSAIDSWSALHLQRQSQAVPICHHLRNPHRRKRFNGNYPSIPRLSQKKQRSGGRGTSTRARPQITDLTSIKSSQL